MDHTYLIKARLLFVLVSMLALDAHGALSVTARGTGTNNSSASSQACSPTTNMTAGDNIMGVFAISVDNAGAGGGVGAITTTSVVDSAGNTWTRRFVKVYDPGAASAGIEFAVFTAPLPNGLTTGGNVTISFGGSLTPKTWVFWEVAAASGNSVQFITGDVECDNCTSGNSGTSQTVTTGTIPVDSLLVAVMACEGTPTITGDSDTTNGNWTSQQTTSAGSGNTGTSIASQAKIQTTASGTQTYDTTTGATSVDWNMGWIRLNEVSSSIKTVLDLAVASVKTVDDLAIASVKTIDDLP